MFSIRKIKFSQSLHNLTEFIKYENGNIKIMQFNIKNTKEIIRVYFYEDGTVRKEEYLVSKEIYDPIKKKSYKYVDPDYGTILFDYDDVIHRSINKGPAYISYYQGGKGNIKYKTYYLNGYIHRPTEEGPAYIEYYEDGNILSEDYYLEGKIHRPLENGPARIRYYPKNNIIKEKAYCLNGYIHRPIEDGPACIEYYETGIVRSKSFWLTGKRQKVENQPSYVIFYEDGNNQGEFYYVDGILHRPTKEGPATILYYRNGTIKTVIYSIDGKRHRPIEEGSAYIEYYETGNIKKEEYCLEGRKIENINL